MVLPVIILNFHLPELAKLSFIAMITLILVFSIFLNVPFFYVLLLNSWHEFALIIRIDSTYIRIMEEMGSFFFKMTVIILI